jgi:hypothetical protein
VSEEAGAAIGRVKSWLRERKPEIGDFDLDYDLIENRVVDSLLFLEFFYFLEELVGRELQNGADVMKSFRTLRTIERDILNADAKPH